MKIEFVPNDFSDRNVMNRLKNALKNTEILRGAVAFWKIDSNFLGDNLLDALNHSESFYIVDISSPTDFDALLEIENKLNFTHNFYVHCRRFDPAKGVREGLLHSKVIVMDKKDGSCEIWVGSHNFTNAALSGLNIESSIIIHLTSNDDRKVRNEILDFLINLKNSDFVIPFDEESYFYFTALQDASKYSWIKKYLQGLDSTLLNGDFEYCKSIEIEGQDLQKLEGSTIIVIGDDRNELSEIEGIGQKIIIQAYDNEGEVIFYKGTLRSRDKIDTLFSKDVQFGERRIGLKSAYSKKVFLDRIGVIKKSDLETKGFYVNIEIHTRVPKNKKVFIYSYPDFKQLWKLESNENPEIFIGQEIGIFRDIYLPKLIQKFINSKSEFVENDSIDRSYMPEKYPLLSIFERRIYVWLTLNLFS